MENETKRISCEYHKEIAGINCYCSALRKCIYNDDYQILTGDIKGCRVNGVINPENIPLHKKATLKPEQLETRIIILINHMSKS